MDGSACVSECLYDTILVRRLWTLERDVHGLTCNVRDNDVGTRCWSTCSTLSQMFSVSTVLGEKASEVKQP